MQEPEVLRRHLHLWTDRERYGPDPRVACCLREGFNLHPELITQVPAPLSIGQAVAEAWESRASTHCDPLTTAAYRELAEQTDEMYRGIVSLGIRVRFTDETEPYETAAEQARHLLLDRTIVIASGLGGNHPVLSRDEYDRFRAVHDVFGHAGIGGGFDRHGEYQAWLVHAMMYTGLGSWAMSSEYRGVNSSLWAGSAAGTGKAALLPLRLFQHNDTVLL